MVQNLEKYVNMVPHTSNVRDQHNSRLQRQRRHVTQSSVNNKTQTRQKKKYPDVSNKSGNAPMAHTVYTSQRQNEATS
ncbi:hypothetical protein BgiMline_004003 [Biomphalaria glabrata]|nr:hypothetical protein BgiMline_030259 [Biomphalaria glabrata]